VKILWIGDGGTTTGFSKVCYEIGERLIEYGHSLDVIAVGYNGKIPYNGNARLWATGLQMGFDRHEEILKEVKPDLVLFNEDIAFTLRRLFDNPFDKEQVLYRGPWQLASYTPIDGERSGFPKQWLKFPELVETMPYTRFGAEQLGLDRWVYHGVDTETFHPVSESPIVGADDTFTSREQIREKYEIPQDAFVIGRVDTNSSRKDWPSTWRIVEYATEHIKDRPVVAFFHTKIRPRNGTNFIALTSRGIGKYIMTDSDTWQAEDIAALMNAADVCVTTTRGEGLGLTYLEYLACGIPVLAPRHSSLPEVVGPGGVLVEPDRVITSPYGHDLRLPDVDTMARQLVGLAREPDLLRSLGKAGLEHVRLTFSWDTAARQLNEFCSSLGEAANAVGSEQPA
jgi:glycosyltransferase involved in cell wall biosynthesis